MKAAAALVLVVLAAANAPSAHAGAGRIAVGVAEGVPTDQVAFAVWEAVGQPIDRALDPLGALVVSVDDVEAVLPVLGAVRGRVRRADRADGPSSRSCRTTRSRHPVVPEGDQGFRLLAGAPAGSTPVLVAVVDSGIDRRAPRVRGRIVDTVSFVTCRPDEDKIGHGTMVAGEIAARSRTTGGHRRGRAARGAP